MISFPCWSSQKRASALPNRSVGKSAAQSADDLVDHNCLQFRTNPGSNSWRFLDGKTEHSVQVNGSFFANDGDAILSAALSGLGICYLPEGMVRSHLDEGTLLPVLPDLEQKTSLTPIQAVVGYRQYAPAKQRVFVEFLREQLFAAPWARS